MKDLLGKELKVGKKVLMLSYCAGKPPSLNSKYSVGKIIGITNKKVKVQTEWELYKYNEFKKKIPSCTIGKYKYYGSKGYILKNPEYLIIIK